MAKRKKTAKRLTKRERKAMFGKGPTGQQKKHIHCVACGRHLDHDEFDATPPTATWITCQHQSQFAACSACVPEAQRRLDEHDRTGTAVQTAPAWH